MTAKVDIGGVWKDMASGKVNIDGAWKEIAKILCNVGGVWKEIFSSTGVYELLADVTIGTATTTVDLTGLNLGVGDEILLVCDIYNPTTGADLYLYVNGSLTAGNYYYQALSANGSSLAASRANAARFGDVLNATRTFIASKIKMTNSGYVVFQSKNNQQYGGSNEGMYRYNGTSVFTVAAITQLTVISSIANAIGVGSRFQVYKIGGAA